MTLPFADSKPPLMLHVLEGPAFVIGLFLFLSQSFFVCLPLFPISSFRILSRCFIFPAWTWERILYS